MYVNDSVGSSAHGEDTENDNHHSGCECEPQGQLPLRYSC